MVKTACVPFGSTTEAEEMLGPPPPGWGYVAWEGLDSHEPPLSEIAFLAPPNTAETAKVWMSWVATMPQLEVLQLASAGFEHAVGLARPGLQICNAAGVHDAATAEAAVTLALALVRDLPRFAALQAAHTWARHRSAGLAGKTVMIFGYGRIGAAVEARLVGFEPRRIIRVARRPRDQPTVHAASELTDLLPLADVVILQCPSTPETDGLFDADMLARLKPGAVLVNAARGSVVDTEALADALYAGRLSAGVDVVDPEPLPAAHRLWDAPNLIVLPHVGSTTEIEFERYAQMLRAQLRRYASGSPLDHIVV